MIVLAIIIALTAIGIVGAVVGGRVVARATVAPEETQAEIDTEAEPPKPVDPLGLKSWRHVGYRDYRVTLNNGRQYEGHILWKSFPDAVELTAFSNQDRLREYLQRLAQQIEWKQHEDKRWLE